VESADVKHSPADSNTLSVAVKFYKTLYATDKQKI